MTGEDEARLFAALFDGFDETPLWSTFLAHLRRLTNADFATLRFRVESRPFPHGVYLVSGEGAVSWEQIFTQYFPPMEESPAINLPEGIPYTLRDILDSQTPETAGVISDFLDVTGTTAIRELRVRERSGVDAWLSVVRPGMDFPPEVDELLTRIVPVVRG